MILFGHLGLGDALASPLRGGLPRRWVLLGTVLPDLADKPLYYALTFATGLSGAQLPFIRGTRSFGHAWLIAAGLWAVGGSKGSPRLRALALGMATHPLLDFVSDFVLLGLGGAVEGSAALWPLSGWRFPIADLTLFTEHAARLQHPALLSFELLGAVLLAYGAWRLNAPPTPNG